MAKNLPKPSVLNLSVEEENLASIPFAVLERRVGKRIGKLELKGTKILPDGTELRVLWQVQGNNELGLPTEQDLDIFVALGVLTFQNNFAKTVTFSGREIARILAIRTVHGKFYKRLKMAMDRFIPLRFRALASTDSHEQVKWCNVFQEASFTLDRTTGRCTGSVTWTDKLIQSMDSGFFRVLDADKYMTLDGITAKHMYRFLAVAFEKTDLVQIDARKLCTEHLGIFNVPKYFSRLLQTLEPAFEQLNRIHVLGAYHITSAENWEIALHQHPAYVPERKNLMLQEAGRSPELSRAYCQKTLQSAGFTAKMAQLWSEKARTKRDFYALERSARVLVAMKEQGVLPHVAAGILKTAIESGAAAGAGRELLDWCDIAVEVCRHKKNSGQTMKNAAGLLVRIVKDETSRRRLVPEETELDLKQRFRQREEMVLRQEQEAEKRALILEYERFRQTLARQLFEEMPEDARQNLRKEKTELLRQQERLQKIPPEMREQEVDETIVQWLAKTEVPPYEKWRLRKHAQQAVLPFASEEEPERVLA